MAAPDRARLHLAQVVASVVAPLQVRFIEAADAGRDEAGAAALAAWTRGASLETAAWLCLGVDLGYFPRSETLAVLERLVGTLPRLRGRAAVLESELPTPVGGDWGEPLAAGYFEEALAIELFHDLPNEREALLPSFQSALMLSTRLDSDDIVIRFLESLLFAEDRAFSSWVGAAAEATVEAILDPGPLFGDQEEPSLARLAKVAAPIDGLLGVLRHLQTIVFWAASARGAPQRWEPGLDGPDAALGARRLVRAVGRVQRWRLDLAHERVGRRLDQTIRTFESELPELLKAEGGDPEVAWPGGLRFAFEEALAGWDEISRETDSKTTDPDGGSSGGSVASTETRESAVEARLPARVDW